LATHQLPGESRSGDDDAVTNAMMIDWVGGSCPAHAVLLQNTTRPGQWQQAREIER